MLYIKNKSEKRVTLIRFLYENHFDELIDYIYFRFSQSFKNKLLEDQIFRFNPIRINSLRVLSDYSTLGRIVKIIYKNEMISVQVEWEITFNSIETYKFLPIFGIEFHENEFDHEVCLESIIYPVIDQSY